MKVTVWISLDLFSCFKQCRIQKHFITVSTVQVPEKSARKKFFQQFFYLYFMEKLNDKYQPTNTQKQKPLQRTLECIKYSKWNRADRSTIHSLTIRKGTPKKGMRMRHCLMLYNAQLGPYQCNWTTVTKTTRLLKLSGRFIPRHCS